VQQRTCTSYTHTHTHTHTDERIIIIIIIIMIIIHNNTFPIRPLFQLIFVAQKPTRSPQRVSGHCITASSSSSSLFVEPPPPPLNRRLSGRWRRWRCLFCFVLLLLFFFISSVRPPSKSNFYHLRHAQSAFFR